MLKCMRHYWNSQILSEQLSRFRKKHLYSKKHHSQKLHLFMPNIFYITKPWWLVFLWRLVFVQLFGHMLILLSCFHLFRLLMWPRACVCVHGLVSLFHCPFQLLWPVFARLLGDYDYDYKVKCGSCWRSLSSKDLVAEDVQTQWCPPALDENPFVELFMSVAAQQ